ncbi:MAG: beta-lactamase family protein [Chitinophagaceae bacterium]|nr:beta-lactamase family protein [Chitinophagaceae bacterium]
MKPLRFFAAIVFCVMSLASHAQYDFTELTQKLEANKKELGKSFAALVFKDGKLIYDKKIGEEFDKKTQTPIAASSQLLTAALVMTFVDEGKLTLDTKVADYLPIFKTYGKSFITIRHCLAHMTGIQAKKNISCITAKSKTDKLEDEVNDYVKREIENNAGVDFWYSNIGPNIAARVLEVMTKKTFDRLMTERIFRPLMMRGTTFKVEKAINPSGGASSSALDYLNFQNMLLNKGMFNGRRILSEASITEMETPQMTQGLVKYTPKATEGFDFGLGTIIQEKDANGKATVISSPSFYGSFSMIDLCRGYIFILFTKDIPNETRKEIYTDFKASIDKVVGGNCK